MASEFAPVAQWVERVGKITDDAAIRRILMASGKAGKAAALDVASDALGGDRKFSNWKGKPALAAGFDVGAGSEVDIKFRPAGLWVLAEEGRKSSGPIFPRTGRGKGKKIVARRALNTPHGPRSRSSYDPSRGLKAYSKATKEASRKVPDAAHAAFLGEIRRVI